MQESNDNEDARMKLEVTLNNLIETIRQAEIVVEEFQQESQPILNSKMNQIIQLMQELDSIKNIYDVDIPAEIFEYEIIYYFGLTFLSFIDEGKNPDNYTKQRLEHCIKRNQATKGKINAFNVSLLKSCLFITEFLKSKSSLFVFSLTILL
jgi:mediator of RNA polymerase II transcription subunit 10